MAEMRDSPYGNLFGNMYASILFQQSFVNSLWEASQADKPLDLSNSKKKSSAPATCKPSNITNSITLLPPSKEHRSSLTPPVIIDTIKPPEMKQLKLSVNNHNRPQRKMLPCEVCGKAFDRPSLLRRHMRTHTGEKPHVCDTCGKGFSTSSSLNTHRRIHSGEKPHECPICGKRFTASSNLYYHRMTHTKDKPHKCVICGKSFPTPGDLKAHAYVHTGNWPFKCSVCNRGFSKQTNMRNHMYLHTGDRSHISKGNGKVKD